MSFAGPVATSAEVEQVILRQVVLPRLRRILGRLGAVIQRASHKRALIHSLD